MKHDTLTLDLYNDRAEAYAEWSKPDHTSIHRQRMMDRLPAGGSVLDFGCGAGWDSAEFAKAGFAVTAIDGSQGMVDEANHLHGIGAICMTFDQFEMESEFDGVWASFTLQHVPRQHLPDIVCRLSRAIKKGGLLFVGMHMGTNDRRDSLGRLYCHQDIDGFSRMLTSAGFSGLSISTSSGPGYDGTVADHMLVEAVKSGEPDR